MKDNKQLVRRMDKSKPRYTPINESDDGDLAAILLIIASLTCLALLLVGLWGRG